MKIINKLMLITIVPILFFSLISYFYIIPQARDSIYREKDLQLKYNVDNVHSLISYYASLAQSGALTAAEAQAQAIAATSKMRYGNNSYFWIDNTALVNVMHGDRPDMVGQDRGGTKDIKGTFTVKEYIAGAQNHKEAGHYINLWYARPDTPDPLYRRVYAKLYEPWGWVICTGVNIDDVEETVAKVTTVIFAANFSLVALMLLFTYWFSRRTISRPLDNIIAKLREMANSGGDLTKRLEVTNNDELGRLAAVVNDMTENMRRLVGQIAGAAQRVAASSEELSANAGQSANAAAQVASLASQTAAATERQSHTANDALSVVETITGGIRHGVDSAKETAAITGSTAALADDGNAAIATAIAQMNQIQTKTGDCAAVIAELGESSHEIGKIISVIAALANQTNLLALNAAIEAARAGEQGRGFAVVAEEVRKLAEESQTAARQITDIINAIQGRTELAVATISESAAEVEKGTKIVDQAGAAFATIRSEIDRVAQIATRSADTLLQLMTGSDQVLAAVQEVDGISSDITQQAKTIAAAVENQSAAMQEITASSQALLTASNQLEQTVGQFKV
ncbi:MAG: methyl-accepting chemotaxis protein [Sporomusaceae bacterium]|nr:methyl-accepting chemotaxis protein [Sporomusaceae bacterium]